MAKLLVLAPPPGIYAALAAVWSIPAGFLVGTAAANAIGPINPRAISAVRRDLIGSVGWLWQASGSFATGLVLPGLACLGTAATALFARFADSG